MKNEKVFNRAAEFSYTGSRRTSRQRNNKCNAQEKITNTSMAIFHFMQKKSGTTRGPPSTNLSAISRLHPFFPQEDYHPTFCGTVQDTLRDIPDTRSVYPPTDDKSSSISPARLCSWVPSNGSSTEGEGGERERERGNENNRDERAAQLTSPRERCGASSVDLIL